MQVKFLSRHRSWRPFHENGSPRIYSLADGQANVLIRRGIAEEVKPAAKRKKRRANHSADKSL